MDRLRAIITANVNLGGYPNTTEIARQAFELGATTARAEEREQCAKVAEQHKALGYMSDRERDYCADHGEEIAASIRKGDHHE